MREPALHNRDHYVSPECHHIKTYKPAKQLHKTAHWIAAQSSKLIEFSAGDGSLNRIMHTLVCIIHLIYVHSLIVYLIPCH